MNIFHLENETLKVGIADWGATITHFIVKENGQETDIVLGFDHLEDYLSKAYIANYPYMGCVVGRYANRIRGGSFNIEGKEYLLSKNTGNDHLHGGTEGFDKKIWEVVHHSCQSLQLRLCSPDGDEGYPGELTVIITFTLNEHNLTIDYDAKCSKPCYVNITHHPYFNITPVQKDVKSHRLQLFTTDVLETKHLIPTGRIIQDNRFNTGSVLEKAIEDGGIDNTFIFDPHPQLKPMALLTAPETTFELLVKSDYPSCQIYTGIFFHVANGKQNRNYDVAAGIAIEPQQYPDSPHHSHFPNALLLPENNYHYTNLYEIKKKQ